MRLDFMTEKELVYLCCCSMKRSGALLGSNLMRNSVVRRDDSHGRAGVEMRQPSQWVITV